MFLRFSKSGAQYTSDTVSSSLSPEEEGERKEAGGEEREGE